jgi:hypothetical protein
MIFHKFCSGPRISVLFSKRTYDLQMGRKHCMANATTGEPPRLQYVHLRDIYPVCSPFWLDHTTVVIIHPTSCHNSVEGSSFQLHIRSALLSVYYLMLSISRHISYRGFRHNGSAHMASLLFDCCHQGKRI